MSELSSAVMRRATSSRISGACSITRGAVLRNRRVRTFFRGGVSPCSYGRASTCPPYRSTAKSKKGTHGVCMCVGECEAMTQRRSKSADRVWGGERASERARDRETERQREKHRHRHTDTDTDTDTHTDRHRHARTHMRAKEKDTLIPSGLCVFTLFSRNHHLAFHKGTTKAATMKLQLPQTHKVQTDRHKQTSLLGVHTAAQPT